MNLDTLELFCAVVRTQSFSRGAHAMGVSQSAASQAVAQLEHRLAVVLVDRSKRPFVLTAEGRKYYEGVHVLLEAYTKLVDGVTAKRTEVGGLVRVAAIYSIGIHAMSRHVQRFMADHPCAKVRMEYLRPNMVVESVLSDDVDLGIVSFPAQGRALNVIPLRVEPMVVVLPPGHRLTGRRSIHIEDLAGEDLVTFDRDLAIRRAIDRILRRRRVDVKVVMEFDNIENIKLALVSGAGISILPEPTVQREVELRTLVTRPLDMAGLERPIGIIHRRRKQLTPVALKFIDELKSSDETP
jgi:DNA-binding transcriptional LysR family regulator